MRAVRPWHLSRAWVTGFDRSFPPAELVSLPENEWPIDLRHGPVVEEGSA